MSQYSYTIDMPKVGEFETTLKFYSGFDDKDYTFTTKYKLINGKIKRQTPTIPDQIRSTLAGIDDSMLQEFDDKFNEDTVMALCGLLFCV